MKKLSFWRLALLWIAYPRDWPTAFSFYTPQDNEVMPPRIGIEMDGAAAWYSVDPKTVRKKLSVSEGEKS